MTEISNNILAVLLVLAIVVSVFSIVTMSTIMVHIPGAPITGVVTAPGLVNLSIEEAVELVMLRNVSDFGDGYPQGTGNGILNIQTNESDNCATNPARTGTECFNNGSEGNESDFEGPNAFPFVARIEGNDDTTCLAIQASSTTQTFLGGTSPTFKYAGKENETGSCNGNLNSTWDGVQTSYIAVCDSMNYTPNYDEMRIHWQLGVPDDAAGDRSNTITVCAAGDCASC